MQSGYAGHEFADCLYLLTASNVLQAVVKRAHPPLVVGRVCCLLLAEAKLVLLVGDEEGLLDTTALSVKRVTGALPSLLTQICFCVHCCEAVVSVEVWSRSFFPSASNFFVGWSWQLKVGLARPWHTTFLQLFDYDLRLRSSVFVTLPLRSVSSIAPTEKSGCRISIMHLRTCTR